MIKFRLVGHLCLSALFLMSVTAIAQRPVIEWVDIPGGTYTMGSPAGEPGRFSDEQQRVVSVKPFRMSRYEITYEQFEIFCEATHRGKPFDEGWGRGTYPVANVTWEDAVAFARWMGCRLPTEAEWEYAARAGTSTPFSTGWCLPADQANYQGDYPYDTCTPGEIRGKPSPVGSFSPNAWGLYDMHGNLWEWCQEPYTSYVPGKAGEEAWEVAEGTRVIRGGCWYCYAVYCRSAYRSCHFPEKANNGIGIRLVQEIP